MATPTIHRPAADGDYDCVEDEEVVMSPTALRTLRHLEGRHVALALMDGSRLDDCELVSAARRGSATLWLIDGDADRFVPVADVLDVWETA
jgi:hypothetical protein